MITAREATGVVAKDRTRRFGLNLVTNLGHLGVTMLLGVWYVPFLVRHLGPGAYGLIPLTSAITAYMGLITLGLNSAVSRYLTIALEQNDHNRANLIFNVSFWGNLALCAALLLPSIAAVVYTDHVFKVPAGQETSAQWLFGIVIAAFLLNQLKTPFGVSTFSRNRLDLQNLVSVTETVVRVGLVVLCFHLFARRIEFVGIGILVGTLVSAIGTIWLWRVLTPGLSLQLRLFDWGVLRSLCGTGGWVIVSQIGVMLYLNIDLIVANRLFTAEVSGRYAAVLQLPALLRMLSIAVGGIFAPTLLHLYAQGEVTQVVDYLKHSIKFLGLVLALPIGLMCGFSEQLLSLWLGADFGSMAPLLVLMTAHLCINLAMYPLYALPLALNKVKIPGIVTLAMGLGNLGLAVLFTWYFDWGVYGLAGAGALTLTARHLLFTPIYGAHILNRSYRTFYGQVIPIVVATGATALVSRFFATTQHVDSWLDLILAGGCIGLGFLGCMYLFLSKQERGYLKASALELSKLVRVTK